MDSIRLEENGLAFPESCIVDRRRIRIVAFSREVPDPTRSSGDRRYSTMLRLLARRCDVHLCVSRAEVAERGAAAEFVQCGIRVYIGRQRMALLAARKFDVAIIEFFHLGEEILPLLRMVQPDLKVIVDSVDVHFLRERAGAQLGLLGADQVEKTKQRELRVYRTADAVIAITPAECEALLGFAGMPPVFVVPNLLAVHKRKNCERKRELLFIGYFEHKPNVDGIIWFVNEVWPKVCMDIPEASLTIVGAAMPEEIRALGRLPGVESVGYVPDTLVYLDRAAVSIAPLRYGGGMKGKVTEAMAAGVPVVTTGVGAQGIPAISGTHLVIGDTVDEFAKGIVFLLRNRSEAERIGQAGQKLAAKLCGIDAGERAIEGMLDGIVAPVPAKLLFPVYGFCRLAWYVFARLFGLELLTVA